MNIPSDEELRSACPEEWREFEAESAESYDEYPVLKEITLAHLRRCCVLLRPPGLPAPVRDSQGQFVKSPPETQLFWYEHENDFKALVKECEELESWSGVT